MEVEFPRYREVAARRIIEARSTGARSRHPEAAVGRSGKDPHGVRRADPHRAAARSGSGRHGRRRAGSRRSGCHARVRRLRRRPAVRLRPVCRAFSRLGRLREGRVRNSTCPMFQNAANVLDIGCGRGEFLEMMRDAGVPARGIDRARNRWRSAGRRDWRRKRPTCSPTCADQPDAVVRRHILRAGGGASSARPSARDDPPGCRKAGADGVLPSRRRIRSAWRSSPRHFYLDPTHQRPIPHPLVAFYMEENGLGGIEVHSVRRRWNRCPRLRRCRKISASILRRPGLRHLRNQIVAPTC